ncbi:hypothetical protein C2S52_023268 [Perilla frutescens var. hirtella]|nr:hypothetical protein C2S52_023268 [Perilla frutescens var. hirtella]
MTKDSYNLHKKHQDIISQLPDDILITIISRLTLREATVTSILSTRWRYLHTYNTHLDFPPFNLEKEHLRNYINTVVKRVLDSHKGGKVRVLKVDTNKARFHKCLEFALTKKAEIIHIRKRGRVCHDCFPRLASNLNIIRLLPAGLTCLKELSLERVGVDDQDFEILVSNSLALESLSIAYTKYLTNVRVVGHPKLKHLDIYSAWKLKSIDIRDVINLVSLKLHELSRECDFELNNIPNFVKFHYREFFGRRTYVELFAKMPCCIRDQLQLLHFSTGLFCDRHRILMNNQWFEFVNVKHLELELELDDMHDYPSVDLLYPLFEACRSLEKLEIKVCCN